MTVTRRATSLGERQVIVEYAPRGIAQNTICMHEIRVRKTYALGEVLHFFSLDSIVPYDTFPVWRPDEVHNGQVSRHLTEE